MTVTPKIIRELDFKVLKEDWFIYKLKDGSILKIKPVLISISETDQVDPETGKPVLAFKGQNIVVVKSPENLKGKPTLPLPTPSEALKLDKEEVEVEETIYEPWNYYELENGDKLKQKLVLITVYRIKGKYDAEGNPYYIIRSQIVGGTSPIQNLGQFPQVTPKTFPQVTPEINEFAVTSISASFLEFSLNHLHQFSLLYVKSLFEVKMEREIPANVLVEAIRTDWSEIKDEVKELLKSYEVPPEYTERVISEIKQRVRSKLKGFPDEDWLTEILSKLYIRLAYELLRV